MHQSTRKLILLLAAAFFFLGSGRETIELQQQRGKVDKLCPPTSVTNGTCLIDSKDIRLTYDFVYRTEYNLIFQNTELHCISPRKIPCDVHLQLTSDNEIVFKQNTKIEGKQVIINAPRSRIRIEDSSTLTTTGMSLNQNGTQDYYRDGAQFVGQGGACNNSHNNYTVFGNYNMMPNPYSLDNFLNQMGSMGRAGDSETAGGGRIVLLADSLSVSGWGLALQANALPSEADARASEYEIVGGSGGYIYVKTMNEIQQNDLSKGFRIEARGGYGTGNNYGGSGGVIVFDGGFELRPEQVSTAGGLAMKTETNYDGCGNGAAGTIFYATQNKLLIDNEHKLTTKKTVIKPVVAADGTATIADVVQLQGFAQVYINAQDHFQMTLPQLELGENTTFGIAAFQNQPYHLYIGESSQISPESMVDFSAVSHMNLHAEGAKLTFGKIIYSEMLYINGGDIEVHNFIKTWKKDPELRRATKLLLIADNLLLQGDSQVETGFLLAYARITLTIAGGVNITSFIENSCTESLEKVHHMLSCVPMKTLDFEITSKSFLEQFRRSYNNNTIDELFETFRHLETSYQVYMVSENSLNIRQSQVHGPRIGLCAPDIKLQDSLLNAAGKGCPAGRGIGGGQSPFKCSGSGGAHGGHGGYGIAHGDREGCSDVVPHKYSFGEVANLEGSSGASAKPTVQPELGGSGGGIIWLTSSGNVSLWNSSISVKGQDGTPALDVRSGSGGGAGGSVMVLTKNIAGDSLIDLSGGDGSVFGGGGGGGGRIVTHLLSNFNYSNVAHQSYFWSGTINLQGGKGGLVKPKTDSLLASPSLKQLGAITAGDGQSGITVAEKCFGGYSGPFCKPCEIGTYKYNFGYGVCQTCTNKPENSFYDAIAQSSSQCSFQCVEGFEPVAVNPQCMSSIDLQVERVGGANGALVVAVMFCLFSLVLWIIISLRSNCIKARTKDLYSTVYDGVLFSDASASAFADDTNTVIGPTSLHMRDSDIWSHTHRMYLIGENSIHFPWFMPKDFQANSLSEPSKEKLIKFIKHDQWVLDWSQCQSVWYTLSRIFFPYFSEQMHRASRRHHFRALSEGLYNAFEVAEWEDITGRTLRVSCDEDSRLAWVDFLDYRKTKSSYKRPQLPITLLSGGNGSLSTPYKINYLDDPLAKSLVYLDPIILKSKLPYFFQNMNTLLDKLCFFKFNRQTMKDLTDVIEWVELGNKTLFKPVDCKMQLYVFENSYKQMANNECIQRRRSMPIDPTVFDNFPAVYKRLIQHVQMKLLTGHSEIKIGLVIKPIAKDENMRINQQIRHISESLGGKNDSVLDLGQNYISSILKEELLNKQTSANRPQASGLEEPLLNSLQDDSMLESQVYLAGNQTPSPVTIIDKSKRAYDISLESTERLEKKLHKRPKRCKYVSLRIRSVLYSLFLMMFKMHGKPPSDNLSLWFLLFSISLSLEILLTFVFFLHVINPFSNVWSIGFAFTFVLPLIALIAPLWGIFGTLMGSTQALKTYSSMNATMVLVNYPLTLIILTASKDQSVYGAVIILLTLNKIALSAFGSKVRQHFQNPIYMKILLKTKDHLYDLIANDRSGRTKGLTPAERAALLVQKGKPLLDVQDDSDEEDQLNDESFGIVSTKKLRDSMEPAIDKRLEEAEKKLAQWKAEIEPSKKKEEFDFDISASPSSKESVVRPDIQPKQNAKSANGFLRPELLQGSQKMKGATLADLSSIIAQAADFDRDKANSVLDGEDM